MILEESVRNLEEVFRRDSKGFLGKIAGKNLEGVLKGVWA